MANSVDILMRLRGQKAVQQGMDQTARATTRLDRSIGKTSKTARTLDKDMKKSKRSLGGLASAATVGFAAAGFAAASFGKTAVTEAVSTGEAINVLEVILGKNAKSFEKWSGTLANSAGIASSAGLSAAGGFAGFFDQANIGKKQNAEMSKSFVQLAGDMASFNNETPEDALAALQSGLSGEAEPLRKFKVFLSDAAVQEEALRSGIIKHGEKLTEQQKIQARYNLVMKHTKKQQGDFLRTQDSLANQARKAKAQYLNMAGALGKHLIPMIVKVIGWLNDFVNGLKENKTWALIIAGVLGGLTIALTGVGLALIGVAAAEALAALGTVTLMAVTMPLWVAIAAGVAVVALLVAGFIVLYKKVPAVRTVMQNIWAVMKKVGAIILNVVVRGFKILWGAIKVVVAVLKWLAIAVFKVIKFFVKVGIWLLKLTPQFQIVRAVVRKFGGTFVDVAKWIWDKIKFLAGKIGWFAGKVGGFFSGVFNGVKGILTGVLNWAIGALNKVIDFINEAIDLYNKIPGVQVDKIGAISALANASSNKDNDVHGVGTAAAAGGVLSRGGGVLIGEEGPELLNLPKGAQVTPLTQDDRARVLGGGESVVHTHIHLDGREVAKSVTKHSLTAQARA